MYKVSVRGTYNDEVSNSLWEVPPTIFEQDQLLSEWPKDFYIDICRIGYDGLSDTANFRHIVEADLEPFLLKSFEEFA